MPLFEKCHNSLCKQMLLHGMIVVEESLLGKGVYRFEKRFAHPIENAAGRTQSVAR